MTDKTDTAPSEPASTPASEAAAAPASEPAAAPASEAAAAPASPAKTPGEPPVTLRSRLGVIAVIALMGVGVYWSRVGHIPFSGRSSGRNSGRPPVTRRAGPRDAAARPLRPEEAALFAPLAAGSALGPATVIGIEGMRDGYLTVNVRIGTTPLSIRMTRVSEGETGRYSFYFMGGSTPTIEATLSALRQVLTSHNDLPIPADLRPFEGW